LGISEIFSEREAQAQISISQVLFSLKNVTTPNGYIEANVYI
jgi:hypothetical protein